MKPNSPVFDKTWKMVCRVAPIDRKDADPMVRAHYLGKWPGVCVLALGLFREREALGLIVFALPPRETSKRYGGKTWELARLWVSDAVPQNGETFLIGRAVRYIKKYRKDVAVLVSYADPSAGHVGTIYNAANWSKDGRTDDERKTPRFDYVCKTTGKKFGRRGHVPPGTELIRVPRISKARYVLYLRPRRRTEGDRG
jgi:hypothetical protein